MLKVKMYTIGKTKEKWLEEALQEYYKRLSALIIFEAFFLKDNRSLSKQLEKEVDYICLDPHGKQYTSEEFSHFLFEQFEMNYSTLVFVIGGADGIPPALSTGRKKISFSKMTFTHQMCRLLLVEQIYRACEIQKGSQYHK